MEAEKLLRFASTSERSDRAVSAIAAVAIVLGAVFLLMVADRAGRATIGTGVASLQLVWIERDEAPDEDSERPVATGVLDQEIKAAVRARKPRASEARGDVEAHVTGGSMGQGRLDLSLSTAPMEFRQGLLEGPGRMAREPVLQVDFQDRSLGGTLQRMAYRRICAELRSALVSQPESHEAIANSMARHKCKV